MQTKGDLDKDVLGEAFLRVKEVLLFPMHISINETANYKVQDCQVSHRVLYGDVVHLYALVPDQNIGTGSVKTSSFQDFAFSYPTNNHIPYRVVNTMLNWLTVAAVTNFSFKRLGADKPVNKVKLGEPPPWIVAW